MDQALGAFSAAKDSATGGKVLLRFSDAWIK
jgi:hypothetical protein